ncbi:MAG TPA: hypothetical protein VGM90_13385 [Kofleriaceae bacterium]|jgi:hypothetical protein
MPNQTRQTEQPKKFGVRQPPRPRDDKQSEEALHEQTKTEVELHPYLDTEGGE